MMSENCRAVHVQTKTRQAIEVALVPPYDEICNPVLVSYVTTFQLTSHVLNLEKGSTHSASIQASSYICQEKALDETIAF